VFTQAFGGDPTRVTLAGSGSGAQCVCVHLASPLYKNKRLFQGAILESGSCMLPMSNAAVVGPQFLNSIAAQLGMNIRVASGLYRFTDSPLIGCESATNQHECLLNVSTADLLMTTSAQPYLTFRPFVESVESGVVKVIV